MASEQATAAASQVPSSPPEVVHVLATTEQGTLAALQKAAVIARSLHAEVVILVPDIVPYGTPLDRKRHDVAALTASYRDLALRVGLHASVRICPCRDVRHISGRLMLTGARIVLSGRHRRWRFTPEEQLARELTAEGQRVTFVDVDTGRSPDQRVS
jgi:hypothetical protein